MGSYQYAFQTHQKGKQAQPKVSLTEVAEYYHKLGINVLPERGKVPAFSWEKWQHQRQTLDDLRKMGWSRSTTTGIGAVCGSVSGNRACVDIDKADGEEILLRVLEALGLAATYPWAVVTPGGGFHVWVHCPELNEALGGKGKLIGNPGGCKQIELRWNRHQSLLPPSRHPNGGTYVFRTGRTPGRPPKTVTWEALQRVAPWGNEIESPRKPADGMVGETGGDLHPYVLAALSGEVEKVRAATEGERNVTLNLAAFALGQLEYAGLTLDMVERELTQAALNTGLPAKGIERTIASGWKAGREKPRNLAGVLPVPHHRERAQADLPAYPVDAIPEPARSYVIAAAKAIGCPVEMVAVPFLAYAGAAIGDRFAIELKRGFRQWAVLWVALVAPPGSAKTPASEAARMPLEALQNEAGERYQKEQEVYEMELAEYEAQKRAGKGGR